MSLKLNRIQFLFAWQAIKCFECGIPLYTKVSHDNYTIITTAPDTLQYFYRLYLHDLDYAKIKPLLKDASFLI